MDMEIQEAITRIEKGFLVDANGDTTAKDFDALRVAISAMNELQKYHKLGTLEEVLEAVERNQEKLIANISKGDEGDKNNGGAYFSGDEDISCSNYGLFVNAWQPLPAPYKEE